MTAPRRMPDLCALLIPEGPDRARVDAALQRAAQTVGGTPVCTPHVTVAYLYDVTPDGQAAYARRIEPLAQATAPAIVTATDVITQWAFISSRPDGVFLNVTRTPVLAALYDGLADVARHMDLLHNPSIAYRFGESLDPKPEPARLWVPHIQVLENLAGDPAAVASLLRPLAPDLSFCARSLWLSRLDEDGEWDLGRRLALEGSNP